MRKVKLLLTAALSLMAWTGVMAQTQHNATNYDAAKNAITDGETYRIKTTVSGTDYYVTTGGGLTSVKDDAGFFKITKTSGGNYGTGFRIYTGAGVFTNPPLISDQANLYPGSYAISTGNDRADWERQILYLNGDGKYAIRSCNCADGTSSWNDAARTHWTYYMVGETVTPCYSYTAEYIWDFEVPPTIVNVTYKLYESDGTTEVSSASKQQEANSEPSVPTSLLNDYIYTYDVSGTIGDTDSEITVVRTFKPGIVHALADLSNDKAYIVRCDRGAFLTKDGYLASTAHSSLKTANPSNFAVITYEDNKYLYSVVDEKFVTYSGALETMPIHGTEDAFQLTAQADADPYFLGYFTYGETPANYGLNTNGNDPYGYVINSWMNADPGNTYFFIEAADFDPTEALAALENYFHPAYFVTYVVKDEFGNTIYTTDAIPTMLGEKITTLPADYHRQFYTYNEVDVTISEQNTTVEFTATWNGPFKLSENFENAQWQNMAMRSTWYVTSAIKDGDGAYKTQNANTMGLVEDSYQWAFVGNGYDGFKIINKAEGDGKSLGWTDAQQTDAGIPTVMDDSEGHHAWKIVSSTNTSVPAGSFCLNVSGTNLYINQYGGVKTVNGVLEGGSLKFWNSGNNVGDGGSAFTVFDIPTNFASFVADEIAPYFESDAKYFVFTDATKAAIGYNESYKTECDFNTYKSMKEALAPALADITNFVLPETGYYLLKNKNYGTYMGIDPSDANMYGNYNGIKGAKNIVKLTKTGDATYSIGLMGKFAPASVAQSTEVTATADAANYTVVIPAIGYAAFQADTNNSMSVLHCASIGSIVGWEAVAAASQWEVVEAEGTEISIEIGEAGFATTYMPFPVYCDDSNLTAYIAVLTNNENNNSGYLALSTLDGNNIPELTPVILEATEGTYVFNVGTKVVIPDDALEIFDEEEDGANALVKEGDPIFENNALKGTLEPLDAAGKYVLAKPAGDEANSEYPIGFYKVDGESTTIAAGKAYMEPEVASEIRAFIFLFEGEDATGISEVENGMLKVESSIYNLAGQRLNKMQKGINIMNGKKILK